MNDFFKCLKNTRLVFFLTNLMRWAKQLTKNYRNEMGYCDNTATIINPIDFKNPRNIYMYEDTGVKSAIIMTPVAKFIMKKHSGAAEGLIVLTGNHDRIPGRFYRTIRQADKISEDKDVIIEEDCWLGVRVTLLPGVTIRRGSTIAAGAVVSRSTPPYSVNGGVPCRFIKFYWNIDQILEHESKLYPEEERYTRAQLETFFKMYQE